MSDTPRTTQIFSEYKWSVNDQETFDKVAALETELAAAQSRLAEIEKAAELPADPSPGVMVWRMDYAALHDHALHLAAENLRLRAALMRLLDGSQHCGEMQWCGEEAESPWEAARVALGPNVPVSGDPLAGRPARMDC